MICSKCQAQIFDNVKFCPNCGCKIENSYLQATEQIIDTNREYPNSQEKPPKKSKTGLIIGVIVGLIVVVAIVVGVLFGTGVIGGKEDNSEKDTSVSQQEDKKENEEVTDDGTIEAIQEVKSGDWKYTSPEETETEEVVISEFVPGTYGGVDFKTVDDVVNYYVEAYNYTKSLTAEYIIEDGSTATYYKLLGDEDLKVENILVEGSKNATINNLVPTLVGGLFSPSTYGLVPCCNRDPNLDNNQENVKNGEINQYHDFRTSSLTPKDVLMANVAEKDGKIVIEIQPKAAEMSLRGNDSQGRFFQVLGDINSTIDSISVLSWSQGTTNDNCRVSYKGGVGIIVIDPAKKEIVEADYTMKVKVAVSHANVTILKNKNMTLDITYSNHYPASDDYLMDSKKIQRK